MTFNYTIRVPRKCRSPNFAAFSWDKAPHVTPNHAECYPTVLHTNTSFVSVIQSICITNLQLLRSGVLLQLAYISLGDVQMMSQWAMRRWAN